MAKRLAQEDVLPEKIHQLEKELHQFKGLSGNHDSDNKRPKIVANENEEMSPDDHPDTLFLTQPETD
jgi:hypothetical protein